MTLLIDENGIPKTVSVDLAAHASLALLEAPACLSSQQRAKFAAWLQSPGNGAHGDTQQCSSWPNRSKLRNENER